MWIRVFPNRTSAKGGHTGLLQPGGIVRVQRVAISVAQQRSAVIDLDGKRVGAQGLVLGYLGEPAAEGFAVAGRIQTQEVGRAILVAIFEASRVTRNGSRSRSSFHRHVVTMAPVA